MWNEIFKEKMKILQIFSCSYYIKQYNIAILFTIQFLDLNLFNRQ